MFKGEDACYLGKKVYETNMKLKTELFSKMAKKLFIYSSFFYTTVVFLANIFLLSFRNNKIKKKRLAFISPLRAGFVIKKN
jgi:hypothetical protein